jgi:hypothetical protein
MLFRAILIVIVLYLLMRVLRRLFAARRPVKGAPPQTATKIDAARVQDATFKDLPDE